MIDCIISKIQGGYRITTENDQEGLLSRMSMRYLGYSKKKALSEHRRNFNLKVDSMLYAIELQYRNHNRYGASKLPNLKGNQYAGMLYYFLLDPFRYDRGEESKQAAEEMLTYLIEKSIKVDTVLKWQKQN